MPIRMLFDKSKQFIHWNATFLHDLGSDLVPCFDTFRALTYLLQVVPFADRRRCRPNQFRFASVFLGDFKEVQQAISILSFAVAPTVKPVIEMDYGELVVLQQKLNFVGE